MRKFLGALAVLAVLGLGVFFWASMPQTIDAATLPAHVGDKANGELLYHIGGCIACHRPAKEDAGKDPLLPSGGAPLKTPIGTFYPPNLTPDPETGIGNWTDIQFVNAMQRGVAPDGQNLIPAFPYTSYTRMRVEDVLDIKAYLMSLTPVKAETKPADLPFPWLMRRGVGVWKRLALLPPLEADPAQSAVWNRGYYLSNGPGHCAECHTPRNILMIGDSSRAFAGGPHPEGKGKVPSLLDLIGRGKYTDVKDLASALKDGEMGGYDHMSSSGMGDVQENLAKLPDADVNAIAEYLSTLK
jgi:mono/diheme cytochrome c family protein